MSGWAARYSTPVRTRQIDLIGIQPGEDLTSGFQESAMSGVGGPLVFAREPPEAVLVTLQNLEAAVGGPAVRHDVLNARVVLRQHALNGGGQMLRHIVRGRDDADQRRLGEIHGSIPLYQQPHRRLACCYTGLKLYTLAVSALRVYFDERMNFVLRIALLQIKPTAGDLNGNSSLIVSGARAAQSQGADLVVTPELARS